MISSYLKAPLKMLSNPIFYRWLLFLSIGSAFLYTIIKIHPFLAISHPIDAEVLVVEGWVRKGALKQAIGEFHKGNYLLMVTAGGPISEDCCSSNCPNYAEHGAKTLRRLGFEEKSLVAVPAPYVRWERTYASAIALRQWLLNSDVEVKAINVFSIGAHARKSYLIYKKVLGPDFKVGIISAEPLVYDPRYWWTSGKAIKWVIEDAVGYLYALFL